MSPQGKQPRNRQPLVIGERFGRFVVLSEAEPGNLWARRVNVRCDCGTEKVVKLGNLRSGVVTSCGCARGTHRQAGHGRRTAEYNAWVAMNQRCTNPKNPRWDDYGGRGIAVCPEWRESFETFLADMGPRPSSRHSIDRKENDLGYTKDNCRWATTAEQSANKRPQKLTPAMVAEIRASTEPSRVIAARLGVSKTTIKDTRTGRRHGRGSA